MTMTSQFDANRPAFEYRVTYTTVPADFPNHERIPEDMAKMSPKPPRGGNWRLVCSTPLARSDGSSTIIYHWERPAEFRQQF